MAIINLKKLKKLKKFLTKAAHTFCNKKNHCIYKTYLPHTAWKVSIFRVFWSVFSRIRTEYGEIRTISPYSVRIPDTEYLSVFSPNAGKYGPGKFRIPTLFTQCHRIVQKNLQRTTEVLRSTHLCKHFYVKCMLCLSTFASVY